NSSAKTSFLVVLSPKIGSQRAMQPTVDIRKNGSKKRRSLFLNSGSLDRYKTNGGTHVNAIQAVKLFRKLISTTHSNSSRQTTISLSAAIQRLSLRLCPCENVSEHTDSGPLRYFSAAPMRNRFDRPVFSKK